MSNCHGFRTDSRGEEDTLVPCVELISIQRAHHATVRCLATVDGVFASVARAVFLSKELTFGTFCRSEKARYPSDSPVSRDGTKPINAGFHQWRIGIEALR